MYSSNIFPPIFNQSYMPAFIYTGTCRVYFALSKYNSINSLYHIDANTVGAVQVSVRKQKTNISALNPSVYPSDIKITTLGIDNTRSGDDKYYIEISNNDIQNGFSLNQYYKVQIRFTQAGADSPPVSGGIDNWLNANLNYFSEWSRVVLIRGISMPVLTLNDYPDLSETIVIHKNDLDIVGSISFYNSADSETLKSYNIQLYCNSVLLEDSGELNSNNNQINYSIKRWLQPEQVYQIRVQITTQNLYSWDYPQNITVQVSSEEQPVLNVDLKCTMDNRTGCIKVLLINKQNNNDNIEDEFIFPQAGTEDFLKSQILKIYQEESFAIINNSENISEEDDLSQEDKIVIRRSSSQNGFTVWQKVDEFIISQSSTFNVLWYDYTVTPGFWYKYQFIHYNSSDVRTSSLRIPYGLMVKTEDIFLIGDGKQLNVRFDPQITNFSYKISEGLIETIGSKYPYIRRNGAVNYRTFSLSGTISCFIDLKNNLMQASKEDVYGSSKDLYDEYNTQNNITLYIDDIYERFFRQKVIDFLQKNNIKLFRSMPQGNLLVKLTNISFTPNTQLNRQIYSFSCTINQIAEDSVDNYKKYNIFNINKVQFNVISSQESGD